jgi:hypothetical protein
LFCSVVGRLPAGGVPDLHSTTSGTSKAKFLASRGELSWEEDSREAQSRVARAAREARKNDNDEPSMPIYTKYNQIDRCGLVDSVYKQLTCVDFASRNQRFISHVFSTAAFV